MIPKTWSKFHRLNQSPTRPRKRVPESSNFDPRMNRVFGLETEYGITVNGAETVDVVAESIELVRRYTDHGAHMKWDYELEDTDLDARGFRAKALMQDTDESAYYEIDKNRPLSFEEIKSDLVLSNGARFYNDHAHPEYSTPECTTLHQIVAHDKAGERILAECARRRNQKLPPGCHFHPRCPHAMDVCSREAPALGEVEGRIVR